MTNFSIKSVVATGIGAALFFLVGWMVNIPTPIPNTSIQLQYAVLALFAAIFGAIPGFLIGLIGHTLKDALLFGAPWWSWVLASALLGLALGFAVNRNRLENGEFVLKDAIRFSSISSLANLLVWGLIAPILDIVIYSEPSNKVFLQGAVAGLVNALTTAFAGLILLRLYAATKTKHNSLSKED